MDELLTALKGALIWLDIAVEAAEIEPAETFIRAFVNDGNGGKREVSALSLEEARERYQRLVDKYEQIGPEI